MRHRTWFKLMLKKTGVVGGPVLSAFALIGLSFALVDEQMGEAFIWGLVAFVSSVWMLRSAAFHENEIVTDVQEVED